MDFNAPIGGRTLDSGLWVPGPSTRAPRVEEKADRSASMVPVMPSGNYSGILSDASHAENRFKDLRSYMQAIKQVPWVFAAISVIAYNYAKGPWQVLDPDGVTEITSLSDDFLRVWNRPNPDTTGFQFRELTQFYLYLAGEYFITLENWGANDLPTEMYLPNPARMRVVQDRAGRIEGYVYDPTSTGTFASAQSLIPYAPWEVIHVKMTNPLDPLRGMGVIEAMETTMNIVAAMTNTELSYWQSGGRIIGVLQTENPIDDVTFGKLVQRWREFTAQKQQRFKTAILEQGLKYQPIAEGLKGLDMTKFDANNRDKILGAIGVPKNKLGIIEDAQYKSDEADRFFWSETMEPLFTRNEDGLQALTEIFDRILRAERKNFEDDTVKLNNAKIMQALGFTMGEIFLYLGVDEPTDKRKDMVVLAAGTIAVPVDTLGDPPPAPAGGGGPASAGAPSSNGNGPPGSASPAGPGQQPLKGTQASATGTENGRSNRVDASGHLPNKPDSVAKLLENFDVKALEGMLPAEREALVEHYADLVAGQRAILRQRRLVERKGLAKLQWEIKAKGPRTPRLPARGHRAAAAPGSGELMRRAAVSARQRLAPKHKPLISEALRSQRRKLTPIIKDFIETFKGELAKKEPAGYTAEQKAAAASLRERQLKWLRERWPAEPLTDAVRELHVEAANEGWRVAKRSLGFKPHDPAHTIG